MLKRFFSFYFEASKKEKAKYIILAVIILAIGFSLGQSSRYQVIEDLRMSLDKANKLILIDDELIQEKDDQIEIYKKYVGAGMKLDPSKGKVEKDTALLDELRISIDKLLKKRSEFSQRPI